MVKTKILLTTRDRRSTIQNAKNMGASAYVCGKSVQEIKGWIDWRKGAVEQAERVGYDIVHESKSTKVLLPSKDIIKVSDSDLKTFLKENELKQSITASVSFDDLCLKEERLNSYLAYLKYMEKTGHYSGLKRLKNKCEEVKRKIVELRKDVKCFNEREYDYTTPSLDDYYQSRFKDVRRAYKGLYLLSKSYVSLNDLSFMEKRLNSYRACFKANTGNRYEGLCEEVHGKIVKLRKDVKSFIELQDDTTQSSDIYHSRFDNIHNNLSLLKVICKTINIHKGTTNAKSTVHSGSSRSA